MRDFAWVAGAASKRTRISATDRANVFLMEASSLESLGPFLSEIGGWSRSDRFSVAGKDQGRKTRVPGLI
jgi:hypothetical protein